MQNKISFLSKTLIFAAATACVYFLIFSHATQFAALCAKGGFWSALPILTVLLVCYLHGSFASMFWELTGVTKPAKRPAAVKTSPSLNLAASNHSAA